MDNRSSGNYPRRPSDGLAQGEWDEKTSGATARSHFRLCHFCLHLNESHTVISQCERCHRSLRNPADSRNLYHRIARHLEDSMSEEEWNGLTQGAPKGDPTENFDDDDDENDSIDGDLDAQAAIEEMLPLNGLSVVW